MKKIFLLFFNSIIFFTVFATDSLKIISWNIFMVPPIIFKSCQEERASLIASYIKEQQADVVIFVESFMKKVDVVLYKQLNTTYPYHSKTTKGGAMKANSGVWIFSKYPIDKEDYITYQSKKSSDRFSNKGATFVEISVNNKKVQLIASHTQSLSKYRTAREKQFQQLKINLADKYFDPNIPQIIAGDLNVNYYDTSAYRSMLKLLDVKPIEYTKFEYSWDGKNNQLANKYFEPIQETLDYILLRNNKINIASLSKIEILHPHQSTNFCRNNFSELSDHYPVSTILQMNY
jgi:phospholipase C